MNLPRSMAWVWVMRERQLVYPSKNVSVVIDSHPSLLISIKMFPENKRGVRQQQI